MENLDCNQIKIFINLKIIGEEDKNKKKIISIFLNLKKKKTYESLLWFLFFNLK